MSGSLLIASNRGPVSFHDEGGSLVPQRGAGGLVTALTGLLHGTDGVWVASAMSDDDRRRAEEARGGRIEVLLEEAKYQLRLLTFDPGTYDRFYNTVSNRLLWFLHHYLWDVPRWPRFGARSRDSWEAYREVNRGFAQALAEEAGGASGVLVQDYHLSLTPAHLRALAPDTRVAYFHHCPFAGPGYMRLVPNWLREELMDGLLGADLLGFQSPRWAEDFLSAARMLPEAKVRMRGRTVEWKGRTVRVGVYPITVDAEPMREQAGSESVARTRERLEDWRGDRKLLLRVDRLELSKNVLRGFLAFETLLDRHPEWRGRVVFLAHLNPSRRGLEEYRVYADQCLEAAARINERYGTADWEPIRADVSDDFDQVLAAYTLYDVLLVNPIFDGMNLVAKEGPLLNANEGRLVLSRNAGAMDELGRYALAVDPLDIAGTADAIHGALSMPADERKRRARGLRRAAGRRSLDDWVQDQLTDLAATR